MYFLYLITFCLHGQINHAHGKMDVKCNTKNLDSYESCFLTNR